MEFSETEQALVRAIVNAIVRELSKYEIRKKPVEIDEAHRMLTRLHRTLFGTPAPPPGQGVIPAIPTKPPKKMATAVNVSLAEPWAKVIPKASRRVAKNNRKQ